MLNKTKKKPINAREKGKRGERQIRDLFREHGFECYRGQQYAGLDSETGKSAKDLIHPGVLLHSESKVGKQVPQKIYDFMDQAIKDANNQLMPVVFVKRDYHETLLMMRADDFLELIKETKLVVNVFCKECGSANVKEDGFNFKHTKKQYQCNDCGKHRLIPIEGVKNEKKVF